MAWSEIVRRDHRIEKVEEFLSDESILHIFTTLEIYDRAPEDAPRLRESRADLNLILDPATGFRRLRTARNAAQFDAFAAKCRQVHIPITCHDHQIDAITDNDAKVIGMLAGNRAGKTEVLAARFVRAWIRVGGGNSLFWWLSPERKQTRIAVQKLILGRGHTPPLLPKCLYTNYPKNERAGEQAITMIDGDKLELFHTKLDGSNLKGFMVKEILWDEICATRDVTNWNTAIARTGECNGQIAAASTPVRGHWARSMIMTASENTDDVRSYTFSCFENPWFKRAYIERSILAAGGHDHPVVRRDYYGEWAASDDALWPDYDPKKHKVQGEDIDSVLELVEQGYLPDGYRDVTDRAVASVWRDHENAKVVLGQDFNVNPMTSVACRVFGDPQKPETWGLFVFDEMQVRGPVDRHCERLKRAWPGAPVACDSTGGQTGAHDSQLGGAKSTTPLRIMRDHGFDAIPCGKRRSGKHRVAAVNPPQVDNLNLMHRMFREGRILVHARCKATLVALDTQEAMPDGRIAKDPGTATDRLSAPTDALRYLAWRLFGKEIRKYGKKELEDG